MRVSVAVTTLGLVSLEPLFESLLRQSVVPFEVVVTDQGNTDEVKNAIEMYEQLLRVRRVVSSRGASLGRNVAANSLDSCDLIFFTDDDCVLHVEALENAIKAHEAGADIVTGQLESTFGQRGQVKAISQQVEKSTVWKLGIEASLAVSSFAFNRLGGFDTTLGVGAATRWQSGEGTDLLIRALKSGMSVTYCPEVLVQEKAELTGRKQRFIKAYKYAKGTGRVYLLHYAFGDRFLVVVKPFLRAAIYLVSLRAYDALQAGAVGIGRLNALGPRRGAEYRPWK